MKNIEEIKIKYNSKNIIISTILLICFVSIITLTVFYTQNLEFMNWVDKYIFRKIVAEEDTYEIMINNDNNPSIFAYSNYITVLEGTELTTYNHTGKEEYKLNINVSNPMYTSAGEYLAIADSYKQKVYLISGKNIIWDTEIDGNISEIYVNKDGYVVIVIVNTSYKTVVALYDPNGKELFKKYLAVANVIDVQISQDSEYLAIAQIDTSGIIIQSKVEIISIEKAQKNGKEAIWYTHNSNQGDAILSIKYNNKNYLTCMYDNSIYIIKNNGEEKIIELDTKKDIYASVKTKNCIFKIQEDYTEDFKNISKITIKSILNKGEHTYLIDSAIKDVIVYEDILGINVGAEAYFLNTSGNLVKKYVSNREIQNIVLTDYIAGIIYRDSIKIISF